MDIKTTYHFSFKVDPVEGKTGRVGAGIYSFNIEASSKEEAKATLLAQLQQVVVQINTEGLD